MPKQHEAPSQTVDAEVYVYSVSHPVLYDYYVYRSGKIRRTPIAIRVEGLVQIVLEGPYPPTAEQEAKVLSRFVFEKQCRLLKFY
jgi:hypothetical protein